MKKSATKHLAPLRQCNNCTEKELCDFFIKDTEDDGANCLAHKLESGTGAKPDSRRSKKRAERNK